MLKIIVNRYYLKDGEKMYAPTPSFPFIFILSFHIHNIRTHQHECNVKGNMLLNII